MTATATTPSISIGQIADWLRLFIEPGQVTELRALKVRQRYGRPRTVAGFFDYDHLDQMAEEALKVEAAAQGVYFIPNQLNPAILARRSNRVEEAEEGDGANDGDVIKRRWLMIDADPVRPAKISSTDDEKARSLEVVMRVHEHLRERGWPMPILADSGNGYHLCYPIDLPRDDGEVVKRCLLALAARFDTAQVKIDPKLFNPARILKLYGTLSRKGDDTPERPHRRSCVLEVP
jgi:hypothetical protein